MPKLKSSNETFWLIFAQNQITFNLNAICWLQTLKNSYQWCFLVVMPNLVEHSSQFSPSPHLGSVLNESKSLKRSCLVATWQLKIEVPLWFKVPNFAPALTSDRHMAPLPFMYAKSRAEKKIPNFLHCEQKPNQAFSRCLKITEKVTFKITSEASYVYILSGQKFIKNCQKWSNLASFWKPKACG